jgi:hypothetical protein
LLAGAGIPVTLLDYPAAAIARERALRFSDLACQALGTELVGLHMTLAGCLEDLGPYGEILQWSLTLQEYLCKGISLYDLKSETLLCAGAFPTDNIAETLEVSTCSLHRGPSEKGLTYTQV